MNLVLNGSEAIEGKAGGSASPPASMDADAAYLASTHLAPDLPAGSYVFLEVGRHRPRHERRHAGPHLRSVLLDQVHRPRPRPGRRARHRPQPSRRAQGREPRGRGTTFRLLLPASTVIASAETTVVEPAPIWHGRGLALVVDDEPSVRHVATRMLVSMGLDVETAASGAEAIEILSERPAAFSVVLLDLTMPG